MFGSESILENSREEFSRKLSSLPVSLTVRDIASIMGISLTSAYKLVNEPGFPIIHVTGIKRIVVPKIQFVAWYLRQAPNGI